MHFSLHFPTVYFHTAQAKIREWAWDKLPEVVAQPAPSHSSTKASECSSSTVPAGSHVIRLEFNHCFKQQSLFYSVSHSPLDSQTHTHTHTQTPCFFIQVKQELRLKTILTQEFMLEDLSSFLSLPLCFYWKGYCIVNKMGIYINL